MHWARIGTTALWGICSIILSLVAIVWSEHIPPLAWMQSYTSATGTQCCSQRDCVPAPVAVIQMGEHETTVVIYGTVLVLPAKSVHQSEDGTAYWCLKGEAQLPPTPDNTRCVFFAVGS